MVLRAEPVFQTFAALSFACSSTIFVTAFVFPAMRQRLFFQIILLIAICDMGGAAGAMIGFPEDGTIACSVQAFLVSAFYKASWLWTTVLSYQLWCVVKRGAVGLSYSTMHFLTWPPALLMTLLPLFQVQYGRGGIRDPDFSHHAHGIKTGWCDLSGYRKRYFLWKLFSWELELVVCFVVLVYFAVSIHGASRSKHDAHRDSKSGVDSKHHVHVTNPISNAPVPESDVDDEHAQRNPLMSTPSSSQSASQITTGSGMDVLKIRMLTDTVAHSVGPASPVMLSNKFDHTRSQKEIINPKNQLFGEAESNSSSEAMMGAGPSSSGSSSGALPKPSSARKTATMISSTLYLYPLCVALTWGPFLMYSLIFEYGELLSNYRIMLYNNLLFNYLSGLAVQSGTFLTLVFFYKSKYARDEWARLIYRTLRRFGLDKYCSCCYCFDFASRDQGRRTSKAQNPDFAQDYGYHKWKSVSVMSGSICEEVPTISVDYAPIPVSTPNFENRFDDNSRVTSFSSAYNSCPPPPSATILATTASPNHSNSRRNSKRIDQANMRPSALHNITEDVSNNIGSSGLTIEDPLLYSDFDNQRHVQQSAELHAGAGEASWDESDDEDDTLILGRRTQSVSVSFSETFLGLRA